MTSITLTHLYQSENKSKRITTSFVCLHTWGLDMNGPSLDLLTPILRTNSILSQLLPESIMVWLIPHLLAPEYNVKSPNKIAEISRAETSAIRLKNVTSGWFSAPRNVAEPLSALEGLHSAETGRVNCETIGKSAAEISMEQGERFVRKGHYFLIKRWDWVKKKKKVLV